MKCIHPLSHTNISFTMFMLLIAIILLGGCAVSNNKGTLVDYNSYEDPYIKDYAINNNTIPPTYAAKKSGVIVILRPASKSSFFNERSDFIVKIVNKGKRPIKYDEAYVSCKWDEWQSQKKVGLVSHQIILNEIAQEKKEANNKAAFYAFASGYIQGIGDSNTANIAMKQSLQTTEISEINEDTEIEKLQNTRLKTTVIPPGSAAGGIVTFEPLSGMGRPEKTDRIDIEFNIEYSDDLAANDPLVFENEVFQGKVDIRKLAVTC